MTKQQKILAVLAILLGVGGAGAGGIEIAERVRAVEVRQEEWSKRLDRIEGKVDAIRSAFGVRYEPPKGD